MPWPSLWGGPLNLASRGMFAGRVRRCRGGRTDGCCIQIGPMTFRACLRPFLLLLHPAQLVFPLCPPLQYGVCLQSDDGIRMGGSWMRPLGCQEGDAEVFLGRENVLGSCRPQKIMFLHCFPAFFWLKTSDEEQCTCTDSRDAFLLLRGLCLDRSIQWG